MPPAPPPTLRSQTATLSARTTPPCRVRPSAPFPGLRGRGRCDIPSQRSTALHGLTPPTARRGRRRGRRAATGARNRAIGGCSAMPSSSSGANSRWPRTASSLRDDALERAVELAGEDDVDDVLRPEAPLRARSTRRSRSAPRPAARRHRPTRPVSSASSRCERVDERLAARTPPPGQEPVLAAALLVAAEEDRAAPAQERRDPDPRLGPHRSSPTSRSRRRRARSSGSSSTSTSSTRGSSTTTSCAIRMPGSTTNGCSRSVLSRITLISPR